MGLTVLIVNKRKHPHGQKDLFVNQQAALKAAMEGEPVPVPGDETEAE